MTEQTKSTKANEEQLLYARILEKGMYTGLLLLLVTFVLYLTGILETTARCKRHSIGFP